MLSEQGNQWTSLVKALRAGSSAGDLAGTSVADKKLQGFVAQ
jgi:hypothetical protein